MNENEPILIFDGVCSFCSATVQFILKHDMHGRIRFAPLQSPLGRELMQQHGLDPDDAQSLLFVDEDRAYVRSDAAFAIARDLSWRWRWIRVFRFVPPFIRNRIYDLVARNRYRWFGKLDSCFIPTPEVRARFLDEVDEEATG